MNSFKTLLALSTLLVIGQQEAMHKNKKKQSTAITKQHKTTQSHSAQKNATALFARDLVDQYIATNNLDALDTCLKKNPTICWEKNQDGNYPFEVALGNNDEIAFNNDDPFYKLQLDENKSYNGAFQCQSKLGVAMSIVLHMQSAYRNLPEQDAAFLYYDLCHKDCRIFRYHLLSEIADRL